MGINIHINENKEEISVLIQSEKKISVKSLDLNSKMQSLVQDKLLADKRSKHNFIITRDLITDLPLNESYFIIPSKNFEIGKYHFFISHSRKYFVKIVNLDSDSFEYEIDGENYWINFHDIYDLKVKK